MASETTTSIEFLSQLLLSDDRSQAFPASELEECLRLAHKHHVVVRWLQLLPETSVGQDPKVAEWAKTALTQEQALAIMSELARRLPAA